MRRGYNTAFLNQTRSSIFEQNGCATPPFPKDSNHDISTQPLLNYQHCGFDLQRDNISLWCFSFISILLGDLPENAALTLTYNSINCKYPCHQCLMPVGKLNDVGLNKDQITSRTPHT